jgi:hypothetical protein
VSFRTSTCDGEVKCKCSEATCSAVSGVVGGEAVSVRTSTCCDSEVKCKCSVATCGAVRGVVSGEAVSVRASASQDVVVQEVMCKLREGKCSEVT